MSDPVPGALFASDYRIERVLCDQSPDRCYLAVESKGGRKVRIVELPASQSLLWATTAIEHPALARFLAALTVLDSNFCVFEEVQGTRLATRLAKVDRLGAIDAVRCALRVAEGLTVLHRAGLVHGAVGPDNVVLEPSTAGPPVLAPGRASTRPAGYRAPDRKETDLAPEDDLWATGALLFEMLTGRPSPEAGISAPEQLEDAGIEEDVLGGIVAQALAADPDRRSARVASMRHPLSCWLDRNEKQPESAPGSKPHVFAWSRAILPAPPRVPSTGPGPVRQDSNAPASRRDSHRPAIEVGDGYLSDVPPRDDDAAPSPRVESAPPSGPPALAPRKSSTPLRIGLVLAATLALCAGGVVLFWSTQRPPAVARAAGAHTSGRRARPAPPSAPASTPAPRPPDKPTPAAAPEPVAVCVARHLPAFSFIKTPDLDWLCRTGDPRPGAQRLHGDIVRAAAGKTISPAMQLWSPLGWYGLAEFAVLRGACCPAAAPMRLPAPAAGCTSMAQALNDLAARVGAGQNPTPQVQTFANTVSCEVRYHRQLVFWQKGRPGGSGAHAFEKLLESAMHPRNAP